MSSCKGEGACFEQCGCCCYDEELNIPSEICTCGHRTHGDSGFCNTGCPHSCKLIECHNYKMCGYKGPQRLLDSHNSMCMGCAIHIGKIKFLDEKDDCPICLINKDMIEISCGKHKFCLDCWKDWSENNIQAAPLTCPLCRNPIWK